LVGAFEYVDAPFEYAEVANEYAFVAFEYAEAANKDAFVAGKGAFGAFETWRGQARFRLERRGSGGRGGPSIRGRRVAGQWIPAALPHPAAGAGNCSGGLIFIIRR
jgi:hypothetical protein